MSLIHYPITCPACQSPKVRARGRSAVCSGCGHAWELPETRENELERLRAENAGLRADVTRLRSALGIFGDFPVWLDALVAVGDVDAPAPDAVVCRLDGGGGSIWIDLTHMRAARAAMDATEPARDEGVGF